MNVVEEKAILLVHTVVGELALGTKHYNKAGKLLITSVEIIQTLRDEKILTIEPTPDRKHIFRKLEKED